MKVWPTRISEAALDLYPRSQSKGTLDSDGIQPEENVDEELTVGRGKARCGRARRSKVKGNEIGAVGRIHELTDEKIGRPRRK